MAARQPLVALALVALVVAACRTPASTPTPSPTGAPTPTAAPTLTPAPTGSVASILIDAGNGPIGIAQVGESVWVALFWDGV
ncbi:MAG: hypothetical protein QFC55_02305, partial [Chloroflexota bacterium]|nr:hypothetical protein [Chloroflexota bacterium]